MIMNDDEVKNRVGDFSALCTLISELASRGRGSADLAVTRHLVT